MTRAVLKGAFLGKFAVAAVVAVLAQGAWADTWYMRATDPVDQSSMSGTASAGGWTNAAGTVSTSVVAGEDYVIPAFLDGTTCTLRSPNAGGTTYTFPGKSLVVDNGALQNGSTTANLVVNDLTVLTRLSFWVAGDLKYLNGNLKIEPGAYVQISCTAAYYRPAVGAKVSGSGRIVMMAKAGVAKQESLLTGDCSEFTGRFEVCGGGLADELTGVLKTVLANPDELDYRSVTVTNNAILRFGVNVPRMGRNRGVYLGGAHELPGQILVDEGKSVTIDGPVTAPEGFVKRGLGTLVLAGDLSRVDRSKIRVLEGELLVRPADDRDYTEVTWICGDGKAVAGSQTEGQWFDTGIVPKATDKVVMKILLKDRTINQFFFCSRANGGSSAGDGTFCAMLIGGGATTPEKAYFRFDRNFYQSGYGCTSKLVPQLDVVYTLVYDPKNLTATVTGEDGSSETVSLKPGDFTPTNPLRIYASYTTTTPIHNVGSYRLYGVQIFDKDDKLTYDFVPARNEAVRDDDKTRYGLYERQGKTFCANVGTRGFIQCEVPDGDSILPNGSFESWSVVPATGSTTYKSRAESYVKSWLGGGALTHPHNVWIATESVADGDLAIEIQYAAVVSNVFTVTSRGVYELSFEMLSSNSRPDHSFDILMDEAKVYHGQSTQANCWTPVARTIALEPGEHVLVIQGIKRDDINRATVFDNFRLVKVGEISAADSLTQADYAESASLALVYDGRWNGDGQHLRNLGTAGDLYDLYPKSAFEDRVAGGYIRTTAGWTVREPVAAADAIDLEANGCTLEVVSRMTGEQAALENPGIYRGLFSTRLPADSTNTDPLFLLVDRLGHLGVDIAVGRNTGWTEDHGRYRLDGPQPTSLLATRTVRVTADGTISYFENGQLVRGGMKVGPAGLAKIRNVVLGDLSQQSYIGYVGTVRLYAKALTDEQIVANAKVDNTRFGTQPDGELLPGYARNVRGLPVSASTVAYDRSNFALKSRVSFPKASTTALTDFPVLVRLAEGQPTGFSYSTCSKEQLAFVQDKAFLDFDVDTWDTNGVSSVWVSVPNYVQGTTFELMVAKDPAKLPENVSSRVWSKANFIGVWHMNEQDGRIPDASGHGLYAVPSNSTPATAWSVAAPDGSPCVGTARYQSDIADLGLRIGDYSFLGVGSAFSATGVFRRPTPADANTAGLFTRKPTYKTGNGWQLNMQNSFTKLFETGSGATISSDFEIPDVQQNWTVFSAIYNSASLEVYTSAEQRTTYAIEAAKDVAMPLLVGKAWSGWIDEVRLRKGVSGPVWLAAENAMLTDAEAVVCAPMTKACCGLIIVVE